LGLSNTVSFNATSTPLTTETSNSFYVNPVRQVTSGTTYNRLSYSNPNDDNQDIKYEISYNNALNCSFDKTFIIDHPDDSAKYLVHACLEGPETGVYYRGKGTITNGESTLVALPKYVDNLANDFTVQLTQIRSTTNNTVLQSSKVANGQFTVYGGNSSFFWLVYAKRSSIQAEVLKAGTEVKGVGPYRWISTSTFPKVEQKVI